MRILLYCLLFVGMSGKIMAQIPVYLLPGQGADERLFSKIRIEGEYVIQPIEYVDPAKGMSMSDYAHILADQIDTSQPSILIGVSLGGMLATELADMIPVEKVIIISSAKGRQELPSRYTLQRKLPLYKIIPGQIIRFGARVLQPILEPAGKENNHLFQQMLRDKSSRFLKEATAMILEWERTTHSDKIIHIHGDKDHTLPIKHINYDYLIEGGEHVMVMTRAEEISKLLNKILAE
ncbi:MAG: alpha/beta hydrolase [Bacteroidota bacterium]